MSLFNQPKYLCGISAGGRDSGGSCAPAKPASVGGPQHSHLLTSLSSRLPCISLLTIVGKHRHVLPGQASAAQIAKVQSSFILLPGPYLSDAFLAQCEGVERHRHAYYHCPPGSQA